jgi:hypothetical protein
VRARSLSAANASAAAAAVLAVELELEFELQGRPGVSSTVNARRPESSTSSCRTTPVVVPARRTGRIAPGSSTVARASMKLGSVSLVPRCYNATPHSLPPSSFLLPPFPSALSLTSSCPPRSDPPP